MNSWGVLKRPDVSTGSEQESLKNWCLSQMWKDLLDFFLGLQDKKALDENAKL